MRTRLLVATIGLVLGACYDHVSIRPDQLPAVSAQPVAYATSAERYHDRTIIWLSQPVTTVIGADGAPAEVHSPYDATLVRTDGSEVEVTDPVLASIAGDKLLVTGGNAPQTAVPLAALREVDIAMYNGDATAAVFVGAIVAATVAVMVAFIPDGEGGN